MGKMKNKVLPVSVLVLFMLMCINACGISKSRDSADMVSELNNRIIEKVAENYEEGNISALDIVIVHWHYLSRKIMPVKYSCYARF